MGKELWNELIKPMLAFPSDPFDSKDWLYEVKYDGTRCIAYVDREQRSVRFLNRRMIFFEERYPELQPLWKDVKAKKAILDGEIVVFDKGGKPNFYKLEEREHVGDKLRIKLLSKIMPATYVVFDILYRDGKDLTNRPLIERKEILKETVKESERVMISTYVIGKGREFFERVKEVGLEGIVAKKLDSPYMLGKRSNFWLKIKALKTLDVVVCGYTTGTGAREEFGSLIAGCYHNGKLIYVGKVGTGFDEEEIKELLRRLEELKTDKCPFEREPELELPPERKAVWVKPKLVCEVKFMNLSESLVMRAPSYVRLRDDKLPEECVLEA